MLFRISARMNSLKYFLFLFLCGGLLLPLRPEKPEALKRAWQEYQFLSLETAEKFFDQVLKEEEGIEHQIEAEVGLAMIYQYREKSPDLAKAAEVYTKVLGMDPAPPVRNLILSNQADLFREKGNIEKALEMLEQLITTSLDSVTGQDALRRWVDVKASAYGSPESVAVADQAAEWLRKADLQVTRERPLLVPILHSQIGDLYFWAKEYEKAVVHYEAFSRIGSPDNTSYGSQASNLYRLAKLYEERLNDPAKAGASYRRLVLELTNSNLAYYSLERAIQLGAISREDAAALDISGLNKEILDELFSKAEGAR